MAAASCHFLCRSFLFVALAASSQSRSPPPFFRRILTKLDGVSAIETNVGAKSVVVTVAEGSSTTKEVLLEALQKWGKASNKSVELDESA